MTATYDSSRVLLVCVYAALSFPYMFRSVDNGLRAMDVRSLTEAAQSLGAGLANHTLPSHFPKPAGGSAFGGTADLRHRHRRVYYCAFYGSKNLGTLHGQPDPQQGV